MIMYGVISGAIIISSIMLSIVMADAGDSMQMLEWLGYLIMLVALSVIFVGIKRYRDQELGGVIKFGTAVKLGLGISVVASIVYVVVWEINLSVTDYSFIEDYTDQMVEMKKSEGVSGAALEEVVVEMEQLKTKYANPLFRLPITFSEIFPVGLLITLISAVILKNSNVLPAKAEA